MSEKNFFHVRKRTLLTIAGVMFVRYPLMEKNAEEAASEV